MATKSIKIETSVGALFVTPTGIKVGARGKVETNDCKSILSQMPKNEARKVRRTLNQAGLVRLAMSGTRAA